MNCKSAALGALMTLALIGTGCTGEEGSDPVNACEISHEARQVVNRIEKALDHVIALHEAGTPPSTEYLEKLFDEVAEQTRLSGFENPDLQNALLEFACNGPQNPNPAHYTIDESPEECEERIMDRRDFDTTPRGPSTWGGILLQLAAQRTAQLRNDLITFEQVCVPDQRPVRQADGSYVQYEDPCATRVSVARYKPGYEEASELIDDLRSLAELLRPDGFNRQWDSLESAKYWREHIDRVKSNGVAAYLAFTCSPDEAFTRLMPGRDRGPLVGPTVQSDGLANGFVPALPGLFGDTTRPAAPAASVAL